MKLHPITGEEIPDPDATVELYRYENPRRADWPEAEFIVGNPPFIGGKDMRAELGDGYAEAAWETRQKIPGGADFVMHFWDEAATRLLRKPMKGKNQSATPLWLHHHQLRYPDLLPPRHRTARAGEGTVIPGLRRARPPLAEGGRQGGGPDRHDRRSPQRAGRHAGHGGTPERPQHRHPGRRADGAGGQDQRQPEDWRRHYGGPAIDSERLDFKSGRQVARFRIHRDPATSRCTRPRYHARIEDHILLYRHGRDIAQRPRGVMVIDLYPLTADEVRDRFPTVYQHVVQHVKPERDSNREDFRRTYWWWFGRKNTVLREFLRELPKFITTAETSKHRFLQFLDANIRPDNKLINVGLNDGSSLSILSSRVHAHWSIYCGNWMGVGNDPVYAKTKTFDPFPFPIVGADKVLNELGEGLDSLRKEQLAEHDFLTMTALYNVLERVRELENGYDVPPLTAKEKDIHEAGLVSVLKDIHDDIDRAVFEAYGWADLIPALVGKPGATMPSPHKTPEQEEAEEELLTRLVALNQERAAEERRGIVRWLRPDYQFPKLGHKVKTPEDVEQVEAQLVVPAPADGRPAWPKDEMDRISIVRDMLSRAPGPVAPQTLGVAFSGKNSARRTRGVEKALQTLVAAGVAQQGIDGLDGGSRYFIPR